MTDDSTASPLAGVNIATLSERLLECEAHMGVLGRLNGALRHELHDRAVGRWREDGAAPTYRIPGLGSISLPVPQTKVIVGDRDAFGSWVADHHPTEATTTVVVDGIPPAELAHVIRLIEDLLPSRAVRATVAVTPAFETRLLGEAVVVDDVAAGPDGHVIDGIKVIPGADPRKPDGPAPGNISVRLDAQAKADAEAQAEARLPAVLEQGFVAVGGAALHPTAPTVAAIDAALAEPVAGGPEPSWTSDLDPADGAPEEDPLDVPCACGCPKRDHRGKTHTGGCSGHVETPAYCRRFKPAPVPAWAPS